MSENFIVLTEFPLFINPMRLILSGKSFDETLLWEPQKGAHFLVINKKDGKLIGKFKSEAFFAFHHVNAFEKAGELIVDIVAYLDASIIEAFNLDRLKGKSAGIPAGELRRYHVDLQGTYVTYEVLSKKPIEFPRINYRRCSAKDYCFVYGVSAYGDFFNKLVKVDVHTGASKEWFEEDCYPGEPVFVPSPDAAKEDDGVILSVVLEPGNRKSFLLILDAGSFEEIARAIVPHHIPFGFHGQYFDGE